MLVEWLLLKTWCVEMCGILFVMYSSRVFYSVLLSLREVRWVCILQAYVHVFVGFGIGMMLLFSDVVHIGEICESKRSYVFRCLMLTLSGLVELLFLLCFIPSLTCVVVSVIVVVCSLGIFLYIICVCLCCVLYF